MAWLILLVGLLWWSPAQATCDPSGTTRTCTAGSTAAQINAAIVGVGDNGTVTLNNGTYSAANINLTPRNGVTVQCQTVGGCTMTGTGTVFGIQGFGTVTNLMRISGFNFTGVGSNKIWIHSGASGSLLQLRIDHNDFVNVDTGGIAVELGTSASDGIGRVSGVMDHNTCRGATLFVCMHNNAGPESSTGWLTGMTGTATHPTMYFEDNVCTHPDWSQVAYACVDTWHAVHTVARFNTVTNDVLREHSMCHFGPVSFEVYGNVVNHTNSSIQADGYRNIHLQGSGEAMVFGNVVDPINAFSHYAIEFQHYRSSPGAGGQGSCVNQCDGTRVGGTGTPSSPIDGNRSPTVTYRGYPCWHQIGRDGAATLKPAYYFLNRRSNGTYDNQIIGREADDYLPIHLVENRDYYIGSSMTANSCVSPGVNCTPFTGASGVGWGTLANRPNTCTPTPEAADAGNGGVGYWATDQGTWKTATPSQGVDLANGVLYRCKATNTWTTLAESYQPYIYPHPLVGGTPPDTTPPAAPTGVTISQAVR